MAFSRAFGPLELTKVGSLAAGTFYLRITNVAPDRLEPANCAARRMAVADRLTPMGRISSLAAAAELDWIRDAGNI